MRSLFGSVLALWIVCGCHKRIPPIITTRSSIDVEGTAAEWRDRENLFQALTAKVLEDLETNWLTPTVPGPNEKGWLIQVTGLDTTRESAFRAKVLDAMEGRIANESDTRIEKLTIYPDFIAIDSALIYVDRGRVWCQGATVSMVGNVNEYRLLRDYRGWHVRTRNRGMFYDPPPPSDDTTSRCVPSKLR